MIFTEAALRANAYTLVEPDGAARLHQNEGAPLSSESAVEIAGVIALALSSRALNCYPHLHARALEHAWSDFLGVPAANLELTAGSSQGIAVVSLGCFAPGRTVAIASPSFSIYEHYARLAGANVVSLPLGERMEYRQDVVLSDAAKNADVVMLCTPNNPTGGLLPADWVLALCDAARGLVVVDEAYIEFAGIEARSLAQEATRRKNLVVLRTLSKAWGLAGLRLGAMVAHESTRAVFSALKPPYAFSFLSEAVGAHVLTHWRDRLEERIAFTRRERDAHARALAALPGVTVFESHANFVCFRHPAVAELERTLRENDNVLIRVYGAQGPLAHVARVSPWTRASNAVFLERATALFTQASPPPLPPFSKGTAP